MSVGGSEAEYIRWQNRAFRFYLAARILAHNHLPGPMAFAAHQAIELMLKATLVYWDRSFRPTAAGHKFKKMLRVLANKVPNGEKVVVPPYFYRDERYLTVSRYPSPGKGVFIPSALIADLDRVIAELLTLVPVRPQHSDLAVAIRGVDRRALSALRLRNQQMRRLRELFAAAYFKASPNNRLQATVGGLESIGRRVGRAPTAPEPGR